jgi:hypothetical protein
MLLNQVECCEPQKLRSELAASSRDCAKLIGIAPTELGTSVNDFGSYLDGRPSDYKAADQRLRRLGETLRGRQYLTAALLLRLVDGGVF